MNALPVPILEILFSRVLHDLVSPVSAVNNGVEFMKDAGMDMGDDAIDLIAGSAHQASVRLQAFRLAYGAGGSEEMVSGKMIYEAFLNLIDKNRYTLEWDLLNHVPDDPRRGYFKLLMNVLMMLYDTAPKGGVISVMTDGEAKTVLSIKGDMVIFSDEMVDLLAAKDVEPTAKNIHAYALALYARHYGYAVETDHGEGRLSITLMPGNKGEDDDII